MCDIRDIWLFKSDLADIALGEGEGVGPREVDAEDEREEDLEGLISTELKIARGFYFYLEGQI